jgi:hypothetical protein
MYKVKLNLAEAMSFTKSLFSPTLIAFLELAKKVPTTTEVGENPLLEEELDEDEPEELDEGQVDEVSETEGLLNPPNPS